MTYPAISPDLLGLKKQDPYGDYESYENEKEKWKIGETEEIEKSEMKEK